jgi:tetratricopeptide (TPR) repeat protein
MQYPFIIIAVFGLIFLLTRPLIVLLHELGHAIPAMLLTWQPVTIYIGSYGEPGKGLHFKIGLLEVWFRFHLSALKYGLCDPSVEKASVNKQIVWTLTGPLTSIAIAMVACYFTFRFDLHGIVKLVLVGFLVSAALDLLNLIPFPRPIRLYNGKITYCDGYRLKELFSYKRIVKEHARLVELWNNRDIQGIATRCDLLLGKGVKHPSIYRFAILAHLTNHHYERAKAVIDQFGPLTSWTSDDYCNAGVVCTRLGLDDVAMDFYDRSLELNPMHKYSLINQGYSFNLQLKYKAAVAIFDKAITIDPSCAYAFSHRGLSRIKLGDIDGGLADIHHAMELDVSDAYAFRNLGIYHLDKGEYEIALELLNKAKQLDGHAHLIDALISMANLKNTNGKP